MEIYLSTNDISNSRPSAVALGFFDGLHLGHMSLIMQMIEYAKPRGLDANVFTFRNHPKNVMSNELRIPRLLPENEKLDRLAALGIDVVFNLDFADGFHTTRPEVFARSLLKEKFCAKAVFCGFNFRFGAEAAGDPSVLCGLGKKLCFTTHVLEPVYASERLISSTSIRRLINSGETELAASLLGRDYALSGYVEHGRHIGYSLGFPTANFYPDPEMTLPPFGVYITETEVCGETFPSVTNIGIAPTIKDGSIVRIESHLLDTEKDLYGSVITVKFKKILRVERRFKNKDALKNQISADADAARRYFNRD